ncbi:hypothetical protein CUJ84_Chr002912 [Rhizobium leguminosarum]|uniref:Uncharacterized protein n=1 Tax=Rhizobium leguminosarum TaxID=384 RepID=A0A2K9Z500_RHILE|nr:hypothetical protein CUJ84_Chr002912 [Rhizobium leguminosarum]
MRRFPEDDSKGINREHGEDYPVGTETVAAPATVSGLSIISGMASDWPSLKGLWPATANYRAGRRMKRQISASQETCRQSRSNQPGGDARKGTDMIDLLNLRRIPACIRLDWASCG